MYYAGLWRARIVSEAPQNRNKHRHRYQLQRPGGLERWADARWGMVRQEELYRVSVAGREARVPSQQLEQERV